MVVRSGAILASMRQRAESLFQNTAALVPMRRDPRDERERDRHGGKRHPAIEPVGVAACCDVLVQAAEFGYPQCQGLARDSLSVLGELAAVTRVALVEEKTRGRHSGVLVKQGRRNDPCGAPEAFEHLRGLTGHELCALIEQAGPCVGVVSTAQYRDRRFAALGAYFLEQLGVLRDVGRRRCRQQGGGDGCLAPERISDSRH